MRFNIFLDTKKLPQHYRMYLLAFIKEMIRKGNAPLYDRLYNFGKKPKSLTYSLYMKDFHLSEGHYYMDRAMLIFSTSNDEIGKAFNNGIVDTKVFKHGKYQLNIKQTFLTKEYSINKSQVTFKILNGLLIESKEKKPLLVTDSNFEKELNFIVNQSFHSLYNRSLNEPIKIVHHQLKKIVVQETNRHAGGRTLYFTGQRGNLTLHGDPEDLRLIYMDGIGLRSSSGWGTLEVLKGEV